jgi:hypothetical protein
MENKKDTNEVAPEEAEVLEEEVSSLSHLNEGETGFNPTPAEFAEEYEGIKEQIRKLGQ